MGAFNSTPQTETINWKNINTNDMSEIPNLYGISAEANKLVEHLNLPSLPLSSDSNSTNLKDYFVSNVNNSTNNNQLSENLSSTSPFISSEMYNFVMNKYQNQHIIGGSKNSMTGGANELEGDSDTSSTSSSSKSTSKSSQVKSDSIESDSSIPTKNIKNEKKSKNNVGKNNVAKNKFMNKKVQNKKVQNKKVQNKATEDFIDYLSSSAHTGGSITESSILNENTISVSTVRTSQINLISD